MTRNTRKTTANTKNSISNYREICRTITIWREQLQDNTQQSTKTKLQKKKTIVTI